jgi:hypothetical protein
MSEIPPEVVDEHRAVVVSRTTIMDGTVVSWFATLGAAEQGREVLSASRNGVMIHGDTYLHTIPGSWLDQAEEAHAALCLGEPVAYLVHYRRLPKLGLVPTVPEPATAVTG